MTGIILETFILNLHVESEFLVLAVSVKYFSTFFKLYPC